MSAPKTFAEILAEMDAELQASLVEQVDTAISQTEVIQRQVSRVIAGLNARDVESTAKRAGES